MTRPPVANAMGETQKATEHGGDNGHDIDWWKRLLCWLGCHSRYGRGYENAEEYTGFNAKMKCRWCAKVGSVDSQGNLY